MIDILTELQKLGCEPQPVTDTEVKVKCPFHNDSSPSCFVNKDKQTFYCQVCKASGSFVKFYARKAGVPPHKALAELRKLYNLSDIKTMDPQVVERFHNGIWNHPKLLNELYKRCVNDDLIRQFRLGVDEQGRITIPITDNNGFYINIRRYKPGAPNTEKMKNTKTRGRNVLWPTEQLNFEHVVITGGEIKVIAAIPWLNVAGYGIVTGLAGEGNWTLDVLEGLRGKHIYTLMDIDNAGRRAAEDVSKLLVRIAAGIYNAQLPLDRQEYPTGDINDYIAHYGQKTNFPALLKSATHFILAKNSKYDAIEKPKSRTLEEAVQGDNSHKRITCSAVVTGATESPYNIPREVIVECTRDQPYCGICPVVHFPDDHVFSLPSEHPQLLAMIDSSDGMVHEATKKTLDIPQQCAICEFQQQALYTIQQTNVATQANVHTRANDRKLVEAYCINDETMDCGEHYELEGRSVPHPKTQKATLLVSKVTPSQDALTSYQCNDLEALKQFRSIDHTPQAINTKINDIYTDLEANITHIFNRRMLHLAIDLTYHSTLFYRFNGRIEPGWVQSLIIGDTSVGKSDVVKFLSRHYDLGETIDSKNTSVAGALGSVQQNGKKWYLKWGTMPFNDRRLIIFEELKGMPQEVFSQFTEVRSSGIARIIKAENREATARCRMIAVSNPRTDIDVMQFAQGIHTVSDLIGAQEDIRRFDFALIQSKQDLTEDYINHVKRYPPQAPHIYNQSICKDLILWAWTREPEQVIFADGTIDRVHHHAQQISQIYVDQIPLVARGVLLLKICKLSIALASRLFSTDETMQCVVVHPGHADFVAGFLRAIYNAPACRFDHYSEMYIRNRTLRNEDRLLELFQGSPDPQTLKEYLESGFVDKHELKAYMGWSIEQVESFITQVIGCRGILFKKKKIVTTPQFNAWLAKQDFTGWMPPAHLRSKGTL